MIGDAEPGGDHLVPESLRQHGDHFDLTRTQGLGRRRGGMQRRAWWRWGARVGWQHGEPGGCGRDRSGDLFSRGRSRQRPAREQTARVTSLKKRRDNVRVDKALEGLKAGAKGTANLMPLIVEASRAYATIGEMCDALREVFGEYEESPSF